MLGEYSRPESRLIQSGVMCGRWDAFYLVNTSNLTVTSWLFTFPKMVCGLPKPGSCLILLMMLNIRRNLSPRGLITLRILGVCQKWKVTSSQRKPEKKFQGKAKLVFQTSCFPLPLHHPNLQLGMEWVDKFIRLCWKVEELGWNFGNYILIRAVKFIFWIRIWMDRCLTSTAWVISGISKVS